MNARPHPRGGGFGPEHHRFALLVLVLIVLALAALTAYLVTRRTRAHLAATPATVSYAGADRALDAARLRYANGELTRDAYLQIVGDLGGRPVDPPPPPGS